MPVKGGANARSGGSVARAMPCETAPFCADVRARAQRSVALISTLFDRLPEIHDREVTAPPAKPGASCEPLKAAGRGRFAVPCAPLRGARNQLNFS